MRKYYQVLRERELYLVFPAEAPESTEAGTADPATETSAVDTTKTAEPAANSSDTTDGSDAATKSTSNATRTNSPTKPATHCLVWRVTQTHLSLVCDLGLAAALLHILRRCSRASR